MDNPAHSFLYIMRNVLVSANLCAWSGHSNSRRERQVHWVSFLGDGRSFVSPSLLVTFACRSGLDDRGGVSEVHAVGGSPASNQLPQIQLNREVRARTHKNKNKYRTRTHKHLNTKQIQRRARTIIQKQQKYHSKKTGRTKTNTQPKYSYTYKYKRATSKYSRKYKPRRETFGPNTRRSFFARRLVCASTTRSELRDKTIFGRSK